MKSARSARVDLSTWLALVGAGLVGAGLVGCSERDGGAESRLDKRATAIVGGNVLSDHALGTSLPNGWVVPAQYQQLKPGLLELGYKLFRFPNGSFSDNYHWNGGAYYSSELVFDATKWNASSKAYQPGFFVKSKYRGTTRVHVSGKDPSLLTDGDPATSWKSDPTVTSTPPRVFVALAAASNVSAVRVLIPASTRVISFSVATLRPTSSHAGDPHKAPGPDWQARTFTTRRQSGSSGAQDAVVLTLSSPVSTQALWLTIRAKPGAVIGELSVLDASGTDLVVHAAEAAKQTPTFAAPTLTAGTPIPGAGGFDPAWDFESFISYLPPGAQPLICVNFGTGTEAEAAAWVEYANRIRGLNIRYWHVGNEMEGFWEEGGPVSAKMYAERFIRYARAMKAVDPSIQVIGPVYSGTTEDPDSQDPDQPPHNWLEEFLSVVSLAESTDGKSYLDGVDLHQYPYWASPGTLDRDDLLEASNVVLPRFQRVNNWISAGFSAKALSMHLSEYNSTAADPSSATMGVENALATTNIATSFLRVFPFGHAYIWQPAPMNPAWSKTPGDFGDIALFAYDDPTTRSSNGLAPSADFWGQHILQHVWQIPGQSATYHYVDLGLPDVYAHALDVAGTRRVLILNLTTSSTSISLTALGFGAVARKRGGIHYDWSAREYQRSGIDVNAQAVVNGGPSSRKIPATAGSVTVAPRSVNVVAMTNTVTLPIRPPQPHFSHVATLARAGRLTGSALTGTDQPLTGLDVSFDDGVTYQPLPPRDGALDGPAEAFAIDLPACSTPAVRARSGTAGAAYRASVFIANPALLAVAGVIDDFDDGDTTAPDGAAWWPWTGCAPALALANDAGALRVTYPPLGPSCEAQAGLWVADRPNGSLGIRFTFKSTNADVTYVLRARSTQQAASDFDDYRVTLAPTGGAWQTRSFTWGELQRPSWAQVALPPLVGDDVEQLVVEAAACGQTSCSSAAGAFWVDNIDLLKCP